jgi:hypothetical protein
MVRCMADGCYNSKSECLGLKIFKLFKNRWVLGCPAAKGFRRNLLIVSWVTPTPGCTAKFNFPGNRYSQPLILRLFGRSGPELPVEYQVEPFFINFPMSTAKKGCRQGPASRNSTYTGIPSQRTISQRQYQNQNHRKIT